MLCILCDMYDIIIFVYTVYDGCVYVWCFMCALLYVCSACVVRVCLRACVIVVNIVSVGVSVSLARKKVQSSRQLGPMTVGSALQCWLSNAGSPMLALLIC